MQIIIFVQLAKSPKMYILHKTWLILLSDTLNHELSNVCCHSWMGVVGDRKLTGNSDNDEWDQCVEASLCMAFWQGAINEICTQLRTVQPQYVHAYKYGLAY
jgi:hypothetical protein